MSAPQKTSGTRWMRRIVLHGPKALKNSEVRKQTHILSDLGRTQIRWDIQIRPGFRVLSSAATAISFTSHSIRGGMVPQTYWVFEPTWLACHKSVSSNTFVGLVVRCVSASKGACTGAQRGKERCVAACGGPCHTGQGVATREGAWR